MPTVQEVRFIMVGGFLGAGKTTALLEMARRLVERGKRVGLITNDQANNLVDTGLARERGFSVEEIPGGCFCCRFDDLVNAADRILDQKPDVLLGEPVGSCTDISATVIQPLKKFYGDWFRLAPYSVMMDPVRVRQLLLRTEPTTLPENVSYLFRKQLEEADILILNKVDLLSQPEVGRIVAELKSQFPSIPVMAVSAKEGTGMSEWLDIVLSDRLSGERITDVDYDTYAEAEAALGWLNAIVEMRSERAFSPKQLLERLMEEMRVALKERQAEVAHLKMLLTAPSGSLLASLVSLTAQPRYNLETAPPSEQGVLVLNARVHLSPEALREIVETSLRQVLGGMGIEFDVMDIQSFSPPRPQPPHRFTEVVR